MSVSCDPYDLMKAARCLQAIPRELQAGVQTYLLCQIANGGGAPSAQDMEVRWTPPFKMSQALGFFTYADIIDESGNPYVGPLTFNQTLSIPGFGIDGATGLTELHFPNLTAIDPNGTQGGFDCSSNIALTTLDLSVLMTTGGGFICSGNTVLTALNLSSLMATGSFKLSNCTALSALSLPALTSVSGNLICSGNTALNTVSLSNWVPTNGTGINFTGCALNQAGVDSILARCIAGGVTTCNINLSGGTNSTPSAAGLVNKGLLITAGNTVATN